MRERTPPQHIEGVPPLYNKMLSTTSNSSAQRRRQTQHRRQQSLEVPILTPTFPANARRAQAIRNGHRRGLSLDQTLHNLKSAQTAQSVNLQDPDPDQNQNSAPGSPPVRIQLDPTNQGHSANQQHFQQETQQQSLAQPGYQAQDFQSHLQQQIGGKLPQVVAPIPTNPSQISALQELQKHVEWYHKNFGCSPESNMSFDMTASQPANTVVSSPTMPPSHHPHAARRPQSESFNAMSQSHARTVPNTPQQYAQNWPSPPPTNAKHTRSQSFQLDVAPMPPSVDDTHVTQVMSSPVSFPMQVDGLNQQSFALTSEMGYTPSAYSSSVADAMSPGRPLNMGSMPTLFEEATTPLAVHPLGIPSDDLLLQAAASASADFNSPHFIMGGDAGLSPKAAMLETLGPNVNASIVDTGIPSGHIDVHISEQHPKTKLFYCLWHEDGSQCDKWFKRKENARSHVQGHMGDRQFLCNDCGKTFVRQHDMKRHAAIHNPDRPHICPCGSGFARHDALTRHRQRGMCSGALPGFEKSEEEKPKRGRPKKKDRPDQESRTSKAKKARQIDRQNAASVDAAAMYASSSSGASDGGLPMTPPDTSDFDADAFLNLAAGHAANNQVPSSWNDTPPTSPVTVGGITSTAKHTEADAFDFSPVHGIAPSMLSNPSQQSNHTSSSAPPANPAPRVSPVSHPSPATSSFHGASSPLDNYSSGLLRGDSGGDGDFDISLGAVTAQPEVVATQDFFSDAFSPSDSNLSDEDQFLPYHTRHDSFDAFGAAAAADGGRKHDDAEIEVAALADSDRVTLFGGREDVELSLYSALDQYIASH